ncbi:hypothetical protein SAMN04488550_2391 [Gordonia malaquae]|uniref:Transposase n=2 Tax=Gordonia TaxID=2053 RepID=M3VDF5_GORML|nr:MULTISPECIES: hypothetical protein [Gordonia]GAC78409.1 hypothetical protein GM1_003_01480 [Gordonia malaquae NBRC 108250]GEE03006.1 hypothetical protein nbrc107696_34520 [Gordonia spumicola]SED36263.1 hypothetical protein SAMN04488550_2391 [Gordonia malaquae]
MTPPTDQAIAALNAHARQRSADVRTRIEKALTAMRRSGATININAVAVRAGVTRKTIYNHPDLWEKIRAHTTIAPPPEAAATDSSIVSALRAQLTANDAELHRLRAELRAKDVLIATLYGRLDTADE